ncbi:Ig-like domain-containing protein [Thiomicrorhabdus indica]|uniref:Ig-like domain-containing protein n=1 Tax=Thiomicrorhabdus indica TaxID=2267253 RepID=UPI002AA8D620|nr:Ig-like domain-containing protein [Thiomicrorhabdus indica]
MINKLKLYIGLLVISMLTLQGCGGPSGDSEDDQISDGIGVVIYQDDNLTFSLANSVTGELSNSIPSTDAMKIDVILRTDDESGYASKILSASSTVGDLGQSQVLTDAQGMASFMLYPPDITTGTAPGVITISSETGETGSLNFQFVATEVDKETPSSGSLQFVNAEPMVISLKGTGGFGFGETSTVTFRVVDTLGVPIEGANVDFSLSTSVGGLSLSHYNAISDSNGEVSTVVNSGTIATPIRVMAEITLQSGQTAAIQSDLLTVTTGIPDQNSFSLSTETFAPESWRIDGVTTNVTVRLGDRFNNPVPDGTVVNFTTEGGLIDSSCQTSNSACTVTWTSQEPRPSDHRVTILAHAIGHESYFDKNGSGVFDDGDSFDDLPEAFRDDDENGDFDPDASGFISQDEKYIDYDLSGDYTGIDGVFNGVPCLHSTLCPDNANNIGGRSNTLTNVRGRMTLIMADTYPNVYLREIVAGNSCLDDYGHFYEDGRCKTDAVVLDRVRTFWVMVEDSAALCRNASGNAVGVYDGDYSSCASIVRSSAATGSSISLESDVGEVSELPITAVDNTTKHLEFLVTVTPSFENDEDETGVLELKVATGGGESRTSLSITDPADVVEP